MSETDTICVTGYEKEPLLFLLIFVIASTEISTQTGRIIAKNNSVEGKESRMGRPALVLSAGRRSGVGERKCKDEGRGKGGTRRGN